MFEALEDEDKSDEDKVAEAKAYADGKVANMKKASSAVGSYTHEDWRAYFNEEMFEALEDEDKSDEDKVAEAKAYADKKVANMNTIANARSYIGNGNQKGQSMGKAIGKAIGDAVGEGKGKGTSLRQQERNNANVPCPCVGCGYVFNQMAKRILYFHLNNLESDDAIAHYGYFSSLSHNNRPKGMTVKWFNKTEGGRFTLEEWMAENKPKSRAKGSLK